MYLRRGQVIGSFSLTPSLPHIAEFPATVPVLTLETEGVWLKPVFQKHTPCLHDFKMSRVENLPHRLWRMSLCPPELVNSPWTRRRDLGQSTHRYLPWFSHVAEVVGIDSIFAPAPLSALKLCLSCLKKKKKRRWFVVSIFSPGISLGLLSSVFATPLLLCPICASSPYSLVSLINLYCTSKHRLGARVISNLHSLGSIDML